MRILDPSFTILDNLDRQSLAARVEYCGRVCYKSEASIDAHSAGPFVRRMLQRQHSSVFEMAMLSLDIRLRDEAQLAALFARQPRFLQISLPGQDKTRLLLTGSIRALRDFLQGEQDALRDALGAFLLARHPLFFADVVPAAAQTDAGIEIRKLPLAAVEELPPALLAEHRFLAVRFVVNRAVSHELVRHRRCSFLQESQRYCRYNSERFGGEVAFIRPLFFPEGSPEFLLWQEAMAHCERIYLKLLASASPQAARSVLPNSCKTEIIVSANLGQWRHMLALRTSQAADPSMREVTIPLARELARRYPTLMSSAAQEGH